jgi:ribosome-associated translation inhibitor RaiA
LPLQIQFQRLSPSPALEARIEKEVARLRRFFDRIVSCRVVVFLPDGHHVNGGRFHVHIHLEVPGNDIIIGHEPPERRLRAARDQRAARKSSEPATDHKDAFITIRDAFAAARRRLKDYARSLRTA